MTNFISLPPDGVGKKVRHKVLADLVVINQTNAPLIYSTIVGSTSEATAIIDSIDTDVTGKLNYYLSDVVGTFLPGEVLRNTTNTVNYATVSTVIANVYTPQVNIADANNPSNTQKVDKRGAALATFPEGTPQFDSFGRMQVSQMLAVGEYYHVGADQPEKYWNDTSGGGSITYNEISSSIKYSVGTSSGAKAYRTTNLYHPYKPATSNLIYTSVACGDTGKTNVVREWGYFDDLNGFGFRLNGTTLQVFIRSDVGGTVVDTVVNQANWNTNILDNSTASDFVLNVTKLNIYWMDFEWMGTGTVRLGVVTPDGRRITCHVFEKSNTVELPYMRTGTLPLRWGTKNTGVSASTSEMTVVSSAVFTESADVQYSGTLLHTSPPTPIVLVNSEIYTPFLSFRPKLTIGGYPNRILGIHETFDWVSVGDAAVHIGIFVNPTSLADPVWSNSIVPGSMLQVDRSATGMSQDGALIESFVVGPNTASRVVLGDRLEKSFQLPADGVTQPVFVFAAKVLKPDTAVRFFYTKYWKEIR
jgi:hypothetical protein